ncbi:MAG: hypothetical protein K8R76_07960 [Candidatus Aegiribacteria sp.]|nr:hypothetical protein [Candidatus Aegiribacteria sp.]
MRKLILLSAIFTFLLITSCDSDSTEQTGGVAIDETPDGLPHIELTVLRTIGVELGDANFVFGRIVDAVQTADGGVLAVDLSTLNVRQFDSDGNYIGSAGREGSGPGEFQSPMGMAILEDSRVIVTDMAGGAIKVFDDSLVWIEDVTGFFPRPPFTVRSAGSNTYTGLLPAFDREEGLMGYSVASLEASNPEPTVIYAEDMIPFDPSRLGPMGAESTPIFTSGNSGNVFVSMPFANEINITGYLAGGEIFLEINEEVESVLKTDEELADEEEEFEEFVSRRSGRSGRMSGIELEFDPILYRRSVSELGTDNLDRLWVRLGGYRYPFWNVYDMSGELLFTASLELDDPDIDEMTVRITDNGAVAWVRDPVSWPKLYLIDMPQ